MFVLASSNYACLIFHYYGFFETLYTTSGLSADVKGDEQNLYLGIFILKVHLTSLRNHIRFKKWFTYFVWMTVVVHGQDKCLKVTPVCGKVIGNFRKWPIQGWNIWQRTLLVDLAVLTFDQTTWCQLTMGGHSMKACLYRCDSIWDFRLGHSNGRCGR